MMLEITTNTGHALRFYDDTKTLTIDENNPEYYIKFDKEDIKNIKNLIEFIEKNRLMDEV